MKNLLRALFVLALLNGCKSPSQPDTISLFNGKDLAGWHADVPALDLNKDTVNPFTVRDSLLVSLGTPGGHLITDSAYSNYRLTAEYRFAGKPGNCGVLVHASTPRALYKMFPQSLEVQMMHENAGDFWCIVEDITVPDMENRRGPKDSWGITEGKNRRIPNLTDGSEKPAGEWNRIQQLHKQLQQSAVNSVNQMLTIRNWLIGYYIIEFEQNGKDRAEYGTSLLKSIAGKISHIKGLDERSLRRFRQFYLYYPQLSNSIRRSLTPELKENQKWGSLTPIFPNDNKEKPILDR